jgi:hypothetical protein
MANSNNKNPQKSTGQAKQNIAKTATIAEQAASSASKQALNAYQQTTNATLKATDNVIQQTANTAQKTSDAAQQIASTSQQAATKAIKKADNVVSISKQAAREKTSNNFVQASETLASGLELASRLMNETLSIGREQLEACIEASNITAECAQKISESLYHSTNAAISDNVEHYKHFFNCRTASDVIELQSRLAQANIQRFFGNNSEINNMLLNFSSKASEPFAEKLSDASDRFKRIFK